jgi:hypothetical protein
MSEPGRFQISDAPHGTLAGYRMGCRCQWCLAANQAHSEPPRPMNKAPSKPMVPKSFSATA